MKVEYGTFYDSDYWTGQKQYMGPGDVPENYHGPSLAWEGFQFVADAIAALLPGKSLLDIGCGGGDLASRFLQHGYDAYGIDISNYAVEHCVEAMRGRLGVADITTTPAIPYTYDLVMATDLLEHIYEEDLSRTFDWMMQLSNRWLFFCVATAGSPDKGEFVLEKGATVPIEHETTAVSGHVNVRHWMYWIKFYENKGLKVRWDLMYKLQVMREACAPWRDCMGWNNQTTHILEKT